jgi:glycosyltransferase involved in cell wall biosynthesis
LGSDQGRDLYKKKLIRLIEQYRLTNQIKFIEHCDDMALAYKVSDIVVSASIEPEAFGRVAVEAQSMEKMIIASDIGGSNETIINEKTGLLFESGDANSLSKKIIQAITMDETSIELIGKEGRKNIIKKFNVEKMCFSTYSEYKRLLN